MAKQDPETGQTPAAKDGAPSQSEADQELAQRRALKEAREREEEKQVNGGKSIDDQEPVGEEDDGQLFVYEGGRKVTLGTLIPKGTPVEHAVVFGSARRKGAGALIGLDDDVLLVVRGKVGHVKPTVTRNDDESVKSVTIETQIVPKVVAQADSEQGMDLLRAVLEKRPQAA